MIEKPERPLPRPGDVLRHAFGHNLANGLSAFLFAASGPGAMILAVTAAAGLPGMDRVIAGAMVGKSNA